MRKNLLQTDTTDFFSFIVNLFLVPASASFYATDHFISGTIFSEVGPVFTTGPCVYLGDLLFVLECISGALSINRVSFSYVLLLY